MPAKRERTEKFLETLRTTKIISVIRVKVETDFVPVMHALYRGGVKIIEITATTPKFSEAITALKKEFNQTEDCFIGAGTILTKEQTHQAIKAGADFIVSPCFERDVIALCLSRGVPCIPGCMTPTEIKQAWDAGATAVKTFPGRVCTPGFYADVLGPFPMVKMIPTGNVNENTAPEYIANGALAVGIGKALAGEEVILRQDWLSIEENAKKFCSLLKSVE